MTLQFNIGENSAGEKQLINLSELPNLFVSYHEDIQLKIFFRRLLKDLIESDENVLFAFSFGSKLAKEIISNIEEKRICFQFLHSYNQQINSIDEFIHKLMLEIKERKRIKRKASNLMLITTPLVV